MVDYWSRFLRRANCPAVARSDLRDMSDEQQTWQAQTFKDLYENLLAVTSDGGLLNASLLHDLNVHIQDFRSLLQNPPKSERSQKELQSGKVETI